MHLKFFLGIVSIYKRQSLLKDTKCGDYASNIIILGNWLTVSFSGFDIQSLFNLVSWWCLAGGLRSSFNFIYHWHYLPAAQGHSRSYSFMFQHRITPFPISGTEGDLPNFNKTTTYGCCELLHLWETQYARNSKENLTLYAKGHSVFSVVSLLILPLTP